MDARIHQVDLLGSITWAFEFEDQPYFDGFRSLATNGIDSLYSTCSACSVKWNAAASRSKAAPA
jgi:hypothetical protein